MYQLQQRGAFFLLGALRMAIDKGMNNWSCMLVVTYKT